MDVTRIALCSVTARDDFNESVMGDKLTEIYKQNPAKFISASPNEPVVCPHPCSIYEKRNWSNMPLKTTRANLFCTNVKKVLSQNENIEECTWNRSFLGDKSEYFEKKDKRRLKLMSMFLPCLSISPSA